MRSRITPTPTLDPADTAQPRPEPRWEKIRALRLAIARGEYETERRWSVTLDRLMADLRT